LTGRAADHIGLTDRGRVMPGLRADLVVFDPATVIDRATYEAPTARPVGIEYVVVGGSVVVEQGRVVRSAARRGVACRAGRRP
jgi:N-acyl-D-amino-acid deacylase